MEKVIEATVNDCFHCTFPGLLLDQMLKKFKYIDMLV